MSTTPTLLSLEIKRLMPLRLIVLMIGMIISGNIFAQDFSLILPANSYSGSTQTYSYWSDENYMPNPAKATWTLSNPSAGTIGTTTILGGYWADVNITWLQPGTVTLTFKYNNVTLSWATFTVTCNGPGAPTFTAMPICASSGTTTLLATPAGGLGTVKWYAASTGGSPLATATSYTTPTISTTTPYYITSYNAGCETASRTTVTAHVSPAISTPTTVTSDSSCGPGAITLIAGSHSGGNAVRWYSAPVGGVLIDTATSFTTPSLAEDAHYYITSYHLTSGCESARVPIHAIVNGKPDALTISPGSLIYGSGTTSLEASFVIQKNSLNVYSEVDTSDYEVSWYASEAHALAGTSRLAKGIVFTTPLISDSTYYFVRIKNKDTNCSGDVGAGLAPVIPFITTQNIQTDVLRVRGITATGDVSSLTDAQKITTVTHVDGIGRPRQQIVVKGSPTGTDIVQPFEYDAQGRSAKNYLPYVSTTTNGSFHSGYQTEQRDFYLAGSDMIADDSAAYARTVYEPSPLGSVTEQGGVGKALQPGNSHTQKIEYYFNATADYVRKFNAKADSSWYYDAKKLSKTKSIDANGNHLLTFADGAGKTILVRQQLDATLEGVSTDYLETYYLYNDLGLVTYIISPKGVAELKAGSWALTQTIKDSYSNQFRYDSKGRVIEKKVPGQAWQYIIYDPLGRVVLTQDGLLKPDNKWMFIKYDFKGNAVMTGIHTNTTYTTRATLQAVVDTLYSKTASANLWFEKQGSTLEGYTNRSFPTANIDVLSVNYFDDYDFDNSGTADAAYVSASLTGEHTATALTFGRATGSKRKILGTSTWLYAYVFYDDLGRTIQVQSTNPINTGSLDRVTNAYTDDGRVLYSKKYHNAGTPGTVTVLNKYEYTTRGDLWKVSQDNAGTGSAYQLVAQYEYNKLGQLVDKKLHNTGGSNFLQSVDYRYTIRGQLKSINNSELSSNSSNDETNDYFGMELLYTESESGLTTTKKYDGNISAMKWKAVGAASGASGQKSYAYAYDKTGRLETAGYSKKESTWNKEVGAQNEAMTYDLNGNIKTLKRMRREYGWGIDEPAYTAHTIDTLNYTYATADKNSLKKIEDAAPDTTGFNNGINAATEYRYDVNGNLTSDKNKGIDSVYYNFLGKPVRMDFSDGKRIEYVYDAAGIKLTQKLYNGDTLKTTTQYANGFVYEAVEAGSPVLSFFGSPEGRVVNNSGTFQYEYSIADHQGNTRVVFSSQASAQTYTATFEASTNANFTNYPTGGARNNTPLYNNTPSGTYSQYLNGGYNGQIGVAKSFKVYPGDKVKIEAQGKFRTQSGGTNITGFAAALTGVFGVSSSSTGEALKAFNALDDYGSFIAAGGEGQDLDEAFPKLFVTILLFDKDHNFVKAAWEQIDAGRQVGVSPDADHDYMSKEVSVEEAGYAYLYVSNENATQVDFYVDDVVMTHTPTNVIQYNEYYPFGLQTSTSWTRENTKENTYLYNAANELNKTSGWYEMYYRGYDPAIGRMLQVDPYATLYASSTTYNYALNNPVMMNDPSGGEAEGPYAAFWNTVLDGVKAKANEPGWYGGSWSNDEGENLFDANEMNSFIDDYKKMYGGNEILIQVTSLATEQEKSNYREAAKKLLQYLRDNNVNAIARIVFAKEILTKEEFFKSRSSKSIYLVAAKENEVNQVTIDMEKGGWQKLYGDTGGDFSGYQGVSADGDNNIVVNLNNVNRRQYYNTFTSDREHDGYSENDAGKIARFADVMLHEVLHITYDPSHQGHKNTILAGNAVYMNAPVTQAMIDSLRNFFNSKP